MHQELPQPRPETLRMAASMVRASARRLVPTDEADGAACRSARQALDRIPRYLDDLATLLEGLSPIEPR